MSKISLRRSKQQLTLLADGEELFTCYAPILQKRGIADGDELDDIALSNLRRACLTEECYRRACWLLGIRDYSRRALVQKLGGDPEIAESVADTLQGEGYLNDADYCARRAERLVRDRLFSPEKAVFTLVGEGFDKETARDAVGFLCFDPCENIRALINTKYFSKLRSPDGARKVAGSLVSRGFSYSDIKAVLAEFTDETLADE